jgi:hypothetical protein
MRMRDVVSASLVMAWLVPMEGGHVPQTPGQDSFTASFVVEPGELSTTGRNPYFVLEPGYQLVLADGEEQLTITVLDQTRTVDGIQTRVVEERETNGGQLVEVSRNFFAISRRTNAVFYFGEEVDTYENGRITGHEGAWLAGVRGARFGLMMPGDALLHGRYYQEVAPSVAMDRAEIVSLTTEVATPAGTYRSCLRIEETTPLEPGVKEYKAYARGVGLVQDGSLKLIRYGPAGRARTSRRTIASLPGSTR